MENAMHLTDAEWKLMQALWRKSPQTMSELTKAVEDETGWTKHTVITLLKRMNQKGAVSIDESGAVKRYAPLVKEEKLAQEQTRSFLGKVFGGRASLLVNNLVETGSASPEEINEMLRILQEASKNNH